MSADVLNNLTNAVSKPGTPVNMEQNMNNEKDYVNAKSYLLTTSGKSGLNL